jgi:hypothetical protein
MDNEGPKNEGPKNEGPKNEGPKNEGLTKEFLDSLNEKERMAYHIAKSHLGTMFSLDKCNAFLEWVNERKDR